MIRTCEHCGSAFYEPDEPGQRTMEQDLEPQRPWWRRMIHGRLHDARMAEDHDG